MSGRFIPFAFANGINGSPAGRRRIIGSNPDARTKLLAFSTRREARIMLNKTSPRVDNNFLFSYNNKETLRGAYE